MKRNKSLTGLAFLLILAWMPSSAQAQKQTDVALSVYGAFSSAVNRNNGDATADIPSNAAGGMIELRHIFNRFNGFEATYSLNRANQAYEVFCSLCTSPPPPVSAYAHAFTADWIFTTHPAKVRYFALLGAGLLYFQPVTDFPAGSPWGPSQSAVTPDYIYGAGLDWGFSQRLGMRLQYRGNIYKAPYLLKGLQTTTYTHTAEPAIGVYYKF